MTSLTINVILTEPLKAYVEARVDSGGYGTPNEYIRELILDDRDRRLARLEDHLVEALTGDPIEITDEEWEREDIFEICLRKLQETSSSL